MVVGASTYYIQWLLYGKQGEFRTTMEEEKKFFDLCMKDDNWEKSLVFKILLLHGIKKIVDYMLIIIHIPYRFQGLHVFVISIQRQHGLRSSDDANFNWFLAARLQTISIQCILQRKIAICTSCEIEPPLTSLPIILLLLAVIILVGGNSQNVITSSNLSREYDFGCVLITNRFCRRERSFKSFR